MGRLLRVLLIEDDATDALLLELELERGGYDVIVGRVDNAASMNEALDRATWDAMIADYNLPAFSVMAALEIVKQRDLDVPFIIVSGTIDDEAAVSALKAGAHDFVSKHKLSRLVPALERELRETRVRCELRRANVALREIDVRYRFVSEHASDGILLTDEEGHILYANPAVVGIFGYGTRELIGRSIDLLVRARIQPRNRDTLIKYIKARRDPSRQQRFDVVGSHKTEGGIRLEASVGGAVQNGHYVCICILRDVTEQRRAEARRARLYRAAKRARVIAEEARQEAVQASRAKSEFLAMMSHELRTPLTAIIGYSELLVDEVTGPLNDQQKAQLHRVSACSQHLLGLIDRVLTFSVAEAAKTTYSVANPSVQRLVANAIELIGPSIQMKGIALDLQLLDSALRARADTMKLQQVLCNLLGNAVKFTAPGGRICVSCEARHDEIRIHVRDTGCGIAADKLDMIFEPFVQLDSGLTRSTGGVGLGLAIARKFMRGMSGRLEVESTLGIGTMFTIVIGRAPEDDVDLPQNRVAATAHGATS
jgi:PAS domain S-box-containing protein